MSQSRPAICSGRFKLPFTYGLDCFFVETHTKFFRDHDISVVEEASGHVARYKLPKAVVFVDVIQRSPSGKADYRWAAETVLKAADGAGLASGSES